MYLVPPKILAEAPRPPPDIYLARERRRLVYIESSHRVPQVCRRPEEAVDAVGGGGGGLGTGR